MGIQENNEAKQKRCGIMPRDMEMKNAVAIQRNAAAIAAIIKTLQKMQTQIDNIWDYIHGEDSSSI